MSTKYYEEMFNTFKEYHPYMAQDAVDYRPKSDIAIRLTMQNGTRYDFDIISKSVHRVQDNYKLQKDQITDMQCRKSFSCHLSEMMTVKGYNQQRLSEYTGISKGSINSYLNATKTPSLTNVRKIAYALDCSIAELLD